MHVLPLISSMFAIGLVCLDVGCGCGLGEAGGFKFAQTLDLAVVGCCLPALLLDELQGFVGAHAAVDEDGAGQENAASDSVFAVDEDAPALLDAFGSPGCSVHELLYGQGEGVSGRQVEELDLFSGHCFGVVAVF